MVGERGGTRNEERVARIDARGACPARPACPAGAKPPRCIHHMRTNSMNHERRTRYIAGTTLNLEKAFCFACELQHAAILVASSKRCTIVA